MDRKPKEVKDPKTARKALKRETDRFNKAVDEQMKVHESGEAAISSLRKAVDEHCETQCNGKLHKAKDSALREVVKMEEEMLHNNNKKKKKKRADEDETRLLPREGLA